MLTRRAMLTSTPALALAVATPAVAASVMPISTGDDTKLFALLTDYQAAKADLAKAKADLDWIADEWRHVWPLAPQELFWTANAHNSYATNPNPERDLAGNCVMRGKEGLDKRYWKKRFLAQGGTTCFHLYPSSHFAGRLASWRKVKPYGRTAKTLAKNVALRIDQIAQNERGLARALEYEAETARLRKVSGADEAQARVAVANDAIFDLSEAIMRRPAMTMDGIQAKVDFFLTLPRVVRLFSGPEWRGAESGNMLAFGWHLSHDLKRLRGKAVQS
ncbi:hypothetical protein [Mesorhizobium sp. IMUNJ 23232]|uniref:hypothetical protein n=1 Tax=Mesorhizobium sp. IMUNJ 23232 TaxID=3376064 RepID=UPI00379184CF